MIQNMNIDKIELIKGREDEVEDREKSLLILFQVSRVSVKEDWEWVNRERGKVGLDKWEERSKIFKFHFKVQKFLLGKIGNESIRKGGGGGKGKKREKSCFSWFKTWREIKIKIVGEGNGERERGEEESQEIC